jgi:hypothetical protein
VKPVNANEVLLERRGGLIEAEVDGELVALHVENGKCYGFNGTATRIWYLLSEPKSLARLCQDLVEEFDVSAESCEAEILGFVEDLQADGLVEISHGVPPVATGA